MRISMSLLITLNCTFQYSSLIVSSTFKVGWVKGDDPYFQATGDDAHNFELVLPSMQVVKVDWHSIGWLILVG